jgi:hypothetical protein
MARISIPAFEFAKFDYDFWLQTLCPFCGVDFETHRNRNNHFWKHINMRKRPNYQSLSHPLYPCPNCPQQRLLFDTAHDLEAHHQHIHLLQPVLYCDSCPRTFWNKRSREAHISATHSLTIHCPIKECALSFPSHEEKYKHVRDCHPTTPIMRFDKKACSMCFKLFHTTVSRDVHILEIHRRDNYQCILCQLQWQTPEALIAHWEICQWTKTIVASIKPSDPIESSPITVTNVITSPIPIYYSPTPLIISTPGRKRKIIDTRSPK